MVRKNVCDILWFASLIELLKESSKQKAAKLQWRPMESNGSPVPIHRSIHPSISSFHVNRSIILFAVLCFSRSLFTLFSPLSLLFPRNKDTNAQLIRNVGWFRWWTTTTKQNVQQQDQHQHQHQGSTSKKHLFSSNWWQRRSSEK